MITILHGDNLKESRQRLLELLANSHNPIQIQSDALSITSLTQVLEGGSLFEDSKTLVLEEFLSKTKKSKEKDAILSYLGDKSETHTLIFWEGKPLSKTSYHSFKNPQVVEFKLPQVLFTFLDAIRPDNSANLLSLRHQAVLTTEPELLFFMIVRHIRMLLSLVTDTTEDIDETKRLAPWQRTKLTQQAKKLGKNNLITLYKALFQIEVKQKSGTLPTNLTSSIDFLLLSI